MILSQVKCSVSCDAKLRTRQSVFPSPLCAFLRCSPPLSLSLCHFHLSSVVCWTSMPVWFHYRLHGMDIPIPFPTRKHTWTQALWHYLTVSACDSGPELHRQQLKWGQFHYIVDIWVGEICWWQGQSDILTLIVQQGADMWVKIR